MVSTRGVDQNYIFCAVMVETFCPSFPLSDESIWQEVGAGQSRDQDPLMEKLRADKLAARI
jgi:hypothetical protein